MSFYKWLWSKKRKNWVYVGSFCGDHLKDIVKVYGTCQIATIDTENVETDKRCDVNSCKNYIGFMVEKKEQ